MSVITQVKPAIEDQFKWTFPKEVMAPVTLGVKELRVRKTYKQGFDAGKKNTDVWEMRVKSMTRQETLPDGSHVIEGISETVRLLETVSNEEWDRRNSTNEVSTMPEEG